MECLVEERAEEVKTKLGEWDKTGGQIKLKKMASDSTTIPMIKQYIKKEISKGFRPDIVLVDYIDCIQPSKAFNDEWSGEGNVMRAFETMLVCGEHESVGKQSGALFFHLVELFARQLDVRRLETESRAFHFVTTAHIAISNARRPLEIVDVIDVLEVHIESL